MAVDDKGKAFPAVDEGGAFSVVDEGGAFSVDGKGGAMSVDGKGGAVSADVGRAVAAGLAAVPTGFRTCAKVSAKMLAALFFSANVTPFPGTFCTQASTSASEWPCTENQIVALWHHSL